uniref:Uncharacterized protein n=1 Tax=Anopheles atroparvus TaxID=41427 RepID=A0A182JHU1_ANOAO
MDRRPFLRNRELSELSPLTQSSPGGSSSSSSGGGHAAGAVGAGLTRNHSYGSILPYLGFLRNSLRRSASSSSQNRSTSFQHEKKTTNATAQQCSKANSAPQATSITIISLVGRMGRFDCPESNQISH